MECSTDKRFFSNNEATIIKRILTSLSNSPTKLTWKCIVNGQFYIKSAYHLQEELFD